MHGTRASSSKKAVGPRCREALSQSQRLQRLVPNRLVVGKLRISETSRVEMTRNAEMPADDLDKVRVAFGGPDRDHVTDELEQEARDPEAQADAQRSRERAVDDGDRARSTAHQDRLGQRAMDWCFKAWDLSVHQITTPPPNEQNDRKKREAANAIDNPNTIWISLRKPPDVSPSASDSPVTMMMMTPMILATGPSTDCRIWLSGCSQGMLEPAADAEVMVRQVIANVIAATVPRLPD